MIFLILSVCAIVIALVMSVIDGCASTTLDMIEFPQPKEGSSHDR